MKPARSALEAQGEVRGLKTTDGQESPYTLILKQCCWKIVSIDLLDTEHKCLNLEKKNAGLPGGTVDKNLPANARGMGPIPGLEDSTCWGN